MSKERNKADSALCNGSELRTCQKEHYDLRRVKAPTKLTEILYIFFGIHTANVVQLADKIEHREHSGSLLKRKYAHGEVLSRGNNAAVIENEQKNPAETTGLKYKIDGLKVETVGTSRLLRSN